MKVLEVFGEPIANGGQESFVINMLKHMNKGGLQINLLTPYYCDNDYYKALVSQYGGEIYCLDLPFLPGKSRFNIYKPLNSFLKGNKYDVVHIHSGSTSIFALVSFCAWKNKVKKIIVHSHTTVERKTMKALFVKYFFMPVLKICPNYYCACSLAAGEWKFSKHVVHNQMKILKNGVDLQLFSFDEEIRKKMRKRLNIGEMDFVIGHVGRFSYEKNHQFLIRIFNGIKKHVDGSKLLLIGEGENLKKFRK